MCEGITDIFCRESGEAIACLSGHHWLLSPSVIDNIWGVTSFSSGVLLGVSPDSAGQSSSCSWDFLGIAYSPASVSLDHSFPRALAAALICFCYRNRILGVEFFFIFETRSHVVQADHKLQIYLRDWGDGSAAKARALCSHPGFIPSTHMVIYNHL